jgi:hypothetical protein
MRNQLLLIIQAIGAEALNAVSAHRDAEAGAFHLVRLAVPDHDVAGLDSGLL